jgi:apolipoprotein N-acyltransferase
VNGALAQPFLVWPEVPRPFYLQDPGFAARARRIAQTNGGKFLVGVVEWGAAPGAGSEGASPPLRPRNSAVLLGPAGERLYTYDKIHLVPFGEYVPLQEWFRFADALVAEVGRFVPGRERNVGELPGGKFATAICFEVVFPHEVRAFVAGGAELLVNISNDGWLGRTGGPAQHLDMARMRAIENRRWLLRSTNNGYTVAIDPYGRVVARLEADQRAALEAPFDFRREVTPYTRYGDWFAWLCVMMTGALMSARRRGKTQQEVRGRKPNAP